MTADYHQHPALSRSQLADFDESHRWFQSCYVTREHKPEDLSEKLCIQRGDGVHSLLLEPDRFAERTRVIPANVLSSNGSLRRDSAKYKDWLDEQPEGVIALKQTDYELVHAVAKAVEREIGHFLRMPGAIREQPIWWHQPVTWRMTPDSPEIVSHVECRCKPDLLIVGPTGCVCIDIKTTFDTSPHKFRHRIRDARYWLQDAHYSAGIEAEFGKPVDKFIFVAVKTKPHYPCRAYELDFPTREKSRERWLTLLADYCRCQETGDWSDEGEGVVTPLSLAV